MKYNIFMRVMEVYGWSLNERHELHNRSMHISGIFADYQKADIEQKKADIEQKKADVGREKADIGRKKVDIEQKKR